MRREMSMHRFRWLLLVAALVFPGCPAGDGDSDSESDARELCEPNCNGRACGDDGCGGSCGSCYLPSGAIDNSLCLDGKCGCAPGCQGKTCGSDGCGGTCGTCYAPSGAVDDSLCVVGVCQTGCQPNCAGIQCGSDGCGGSCGTCPGGKPCNNGQCAGCAEVCAGNEECVDGKCKPICEADCEGHECGPDGCGGSCGSCSGTNACNNVGQCVPKLDFDCLGVETPSATGCDYAKSFEGCCDDFGRLIWCDSGKTFCLDCSGNPKCGWNAENSYYDCGTSGGMDPNGTFPKSCTDAICVPSCSGKACGPDGCGGFCGDCPSNQKCTVDGQCICQYTQCNKCCDGPGQICNINNQCCSPSCAGKQCGGDGCGALCGVCLGGADCVNGTCQKPLNDTCGPCTSDSDCKAGGICVPRSSAVPGGWQGNVPSGKYCQAACTKDSECPSGIPCKSGHCKIGTKDNADFCGSKLLWCLMDDCGAVLSCVDCFQLFKSDPDVVGGECYLAQYGGAGCKGFTDGCYESPKKCTSAGGYLWCCETWQTATKCCYKCEGADGMGWSGCDDL